MCDFDDFEKSEDDGFMDDDQLEDEFPMKPSWPMVRTWMPSRRSLETMNLLRDAFFIGSIACV